jgi:DNA-binding NarL/FixJ family response regulator
MANGQIMNQPGAQGAVVALLNDLIFETKIRSTAQALGIQVTVVRALDALGSELERLRPSLLLADLNTAGPNVVQALATVHGHPARPYVVAYVSHIDQDLAQHAKDAGADQVMPRSRFNAELPRILQRHCAPA